MNKPRKLISADEAVVGKVQHTKPCSDCPYRRDSLNGWLGGGTVDQFLQIAHSNTRYDCHTIKGQQCAGLAIYRRNTCKHVEPPLLVLPVDHETCLSNPMEFREHHEARPGTVTRPSTSKGSVDLPSLFIIVSVAVLMIFVVALAREDSRKWEAFKAAHDCKRVAHISGDVFNTIGIGGNGQVTIGIGSTPGKTGWACNDGMTYYR